MARFAVGIPRREQSRWQGWLASLLAHLLLLAVLILPAVESDTPLPHAEGAGGPGPAGGGGGGLGDEGGPRLRFVQIAPPAAAPPAAPAVAPPVQPVPKAIEQTVPPPRPPVTPQVPAAAVTPATPAPTAGSVAGAGTGVGKTGGAGAGPGSGGGVGSGEGPGRGSGVGPGTGGGTAQNYPPTPRQFFLPPTAPASVRGFHLTAWFDVDSTGKATLLRFTPSPDRDYNNRLRETLLAMRFRPAVRPDGVPVRDTVDVQFVFY